MLSIEKLKVGSMGCNCYIVYDSEDEEALIIDPGDDADFIIRKITELNLTPKMILATHAHFDHNMAAYEVQNTFNIPYAISEKDQFLLKNMPKSAMHFVNIETVFIPNVDKLLKKGQRIEIGKSYFKVLETPGHTPGGVSFYNQNEKIIFCGDILFKDGAIGRYDFSYSSVTDLFKSIDRILALSSDTIVYPGHGAETSVGSEVSKVGGKF